MLLYGGCMDSNLSNEIDMLNGNINRMCVTNQLKELTEMYEWAERRLQKIHKICLENIDDINS